MDITVSSEEEIVGNRSTLGRVEVTVPLSVSAADAWQALTETTIVAHWFGALTPALRPGGSARLDFGDGDFFVVEAIRLDPPHLLEYSWRFLGIGPLDHISWRIVPKDTGCLVTVSDSEAERPREAALFLEQGWLDFTQRLERFLTTNEPTRYDWRRELEASIELPATIQIAEEALFASQMQAQWLPLGGCILEAGAHVTLTDGIKPSVLQITDVVRESPARVRFQLIDSGWLHPTSCQLELSPRRNDTLLSVEHLGWENISLSSNDQLQQRKRFCACWIDALQRARQVIEGLSCKK